MAGRRRKRAKPKRTSKPEFVLLDEGEAMLNEAQICVYGMWPFGPEHHLWLHIEPLDRTGRRTLDVLRVYDPVDGPRQMRRAEVESYIAAHGTQEAHWGTERVPDDYAGRTDLEAATGRIRALGGDTSVDLDHQSGKESLSVVICVLGPSEMPCFAPVGRLDVERSTDGLATVDTAALEAVAADLMQRTSASYSV